MKTSIHPIHIFLVVASLLAIGCKDSPDGNTDDAGRDSSVADAGTDAAEVDDGSVPDGEVPDGGGCTPQTTDAGCYVCPQETIHFLNQCNTGYCSPFANSRITYPGYTPGGPYPAIP